LDLAALLTEHRIADEWSTPKARAKLASVVHLILESGHRYAEAENAAFWVSLHSRWLGKLLTSRDASAAVQTLCDLGVIERNDRYSAGRFSKSYRLAQPYRDAPLAFQPLTDAPLARKLREHSDERTIEAIGDNQARTAVFRSLQTITIAPEAKEFAESHPFTSSAQRASWLLTLQDFAQRRFWLRADENTGRIFHNVTQCPRGLRKFLRIEGEHVAEVDIAAAQPFFALSLFPKDHPERAAYARLVTSNDFYAELFMRMPKANRRAWGSELEAWTRDSTHRDRFKRHTLRHVFYDVMPTDKSPAVFQAVGDVSPWLAGELALRRVCGASELATCLQTKEADLVLGRVIPRVMHELPDCRVSSIHDGFLCSDRFASDLKAIIEEEAARMLGVCPVVRVKSDRRARRLARGDF
jgi:hypothetical protein